MLMLSVVIASFHIIQPASHIPSSCFSLRSNTLIVYRQLALFRHAYRCFYLYQSASYIRIVLQNVLIGPKQWF